MDYIYYLIGSGGYLPHPILEKIQITAEEIQDIRGESDESDKSIINYILEECKAELRQKFADVVILTESEYNQLFKGVSQSIH